MVNTDLIVQRYQDLLNMIQDADLRRLVVHTTPLYFYDCPGAKGHHHAYRHGLIQHTVEVAEIAVSMLECNTDASQRDIDIMVVAALLHDVAKVNEYILCKDANGNDVIKSGDFTIGHVIESVCMMERANAQGVHILQTTIDEIKRIMLAHHGLMEWGTPASCDVTQCYNGEPKCTVAQCILFSADMASAEKKCHMYPMRVANMIGIPERGY